MILFSLASLAPLSHRWAASGARRGDGSARGSPVASAFDSR